MPKPARGRNHPIEGSAAELDEARQTASSTFNGRPLIVDLTRIDSVDNAGRELIAKWQSLGAQLVVTTPEAQARIQSMTNMPIVFLERKRRSKWLRLQALLAPTATLLMLLMLILMG